MRVSLFLILLFSSLFSDEEIAKADPPAIENPQVALGDEPATISAAPTVRQEALLPSPPQAQDGYTINYNTVSIIEYIRFASKICKANFIYEETDLNFTVTVVSDEPVTPANVMATLIQVLRVHGLLLLEQDNNLVIHKSSEVKQVATLVTEDGMEGNAAIVTRIFRIKNAKPDSIAAIIQPMISSSALLETSAETRQLILTDLKANVDKIAVLIENLDSPHTLLEIKSFAAQHNKPDFLIELASQIMNPIAQGNPFILVPQNLANEVFIVSTPDLVQKTISVFTSLDTVPKVEPTHLKKVNPENVFVYKVMNRSGDEVLKSLENIANNLQHSAAADPDLIETIDSAKWIRETNSLMFIGSKSSLDKTKEFLSALDVPVGAPTYQAKTSFFVYKPQFRSAADIEKSILEMAHNLQGSKGADPSLIETIQSVKINPLTHTLSFSGEEKNFDQIRQLLATIDSASSKMSATPAIPPSTQFYIYKPVHQTGEELSSELKDVMAQLKSDKLADPAFMHSLGTMKWVKSTHSLMFTGDPASLEKIQTLIGNFDIPTAKHVPKTFFQYHPQYASEEKTENYLKQVTQNLSKKGGSESLIETLRSYKWISDSQTFMFYGNEVDLAQVKDLLTTFDIPTRKAEKTFYQYHPQYATEAKTKSYLDDVAQNLSKKGGSESLVETLKSYKWIPDSQTFMFYGSDADLAQVKDLLNTFDTPNLAVKKTEMTFYQYHLQYATEAKTKHYLDDVAQNLSKKGGSESLVETLKSYKWIPDSQTFMFYGSDANLAQVKDLLNTFDTPNLAVKKTEMTFYQYHPKYATEAKTKNYLEDVAQNLSKKGGSESLVETLKSYKWIPDSQTFMFYGSDADLAQVKDLLNTFDTQNLEPKPEAKPSYYIYKVQHTTGDVIEEDLDLLSKNFKSSGLKDAKILDVISKMRYVKQTNSLLLSGDPAAIEEVKGLIAQYDYPRTAAPGPASSSFYMYKPQHLKAAQIEKSLKDLGTNLKNAGLADPSLLKTIDSMKYVDTTNSLIFTGPPDALQKIQEVTKEIDVPPAVHAPIQHVGKSTFLLYKLKNASGPQIVTSLKNMAAELKKTGTSDKDFLAALNSIKYVKETHSLFFTGTDEALGKVQMLVTEFDVTSLAAKIQAPPTITGPSNFFVYKTQSLAGPDLEKLLTDFAENLSNSGLNDPDLFNAIRSMRWTDKTQTLVFTGTPKALDQVKELLKQFDIPSNLPGGPTLGGPLEPSIQAIDNTSFLVYKLQFHKGDEIQGALRQIAKDLIISNAPVNQGLLNSINSIQWLEVTNSLLCSGDQETLTRLRELIKNLDVPLKQVFIEMLMIETSMANALTFGLEWGGSFKYRDKFSTNTFNTPFSQNTTPDTFISNLAGLAAPKTPTPSLIPASASGFDLGVIGEVIRHKGQTFLTLGSLLSALQTDDETSIIMTPKIITQDGRTSTLFRGENIPFAGSFVSNTQGGGTINTSNIEYRDIGVSLTVTPVLGNSDIVTLDINLDSSSTLGDITQASLTPGAATAQGIITSKTTMETTVHVPDNNFLILSGMVSNSNVKSKNGIPCLGGLPLVGALFSKNNDSITNTNIVIFIRPHIINSVEDMRKISTKEEDFFRDQTGSPFLEKNFDEGMELIKTVDDE